MHPAPVTRSTTRHRQVCVAFVALVGAVVIGACSSANDTGAAPPTSAPTTTLPPLTTTTEPPCRPDGRSVERDGVRVREFCGPAAARVDVGEQVIEFSGGACVRQIESVEVNVGAEVLEPGADDVVVAPRFPVFHLVMGVHPLAPDDSPPVATDGSYNSGVLTFGAPGESWVVNDKTVTLTASRTAGTFTGVAFRVAAPEEPVEVSGAFTCDTSAIPLADLIVPPGPDDADGGTTPDEG